MNTKKLLQLTSLGAFMAASTASSVSAATVFSTVDYNSYDNPAQGAATISPFAAIFGAISEQNPNGDAGEVDIPSYDFRGLTATVVPDQSYFFLEDFEDGQFDVPGATPNALTIRTNDGRNGSDANTRTYSVDEDDGAVDGLFGNPEGMARSLTRVDFTLSTLLNLPTYVGIVATNKATTTINAYNSDDMLLGTATSGTAVNTGGFAGLQTDEGIAYFTISGTNITLDHVQYGYAVVPEPSTSALLGLGGLALILRRRK
jgi:hypothetical protein